jgi:hypothetical protein
VDDVAGAGDHFERGDGGGEVSVVDTGAVGGGGAGSDDGDVRKGGEVVDGESFCIEPGSEQAVLHASADGDCGKAGVEGHLI